MVDKRVWVSVDGCWLSVVEKYVVNRSIYFRIGVLLRWECNLLFDFNLYPMKKAIVLSLLVGSVVMGFTTYHTGGKCTGSANCKACKNCKYCKHCAKNGGTCGVCR